MRAILLAYLMLAAVPVTPAAGAHSQHVRVTASVEVTRPCKASVSEDRHVELRGDCDDEDDAPHFQTGGDQDNRPTYRIDRDETTGLTTIEF